MTQQKNYYELLHVNIDAPAEVIRSSYRVLMQQLKMHPDLGGDPENAAQVNKAYQVLMDPDERAQYDSQINQSAEVDDSEPLTPKHSQQDENQFKSINLETHCAFCHTPHQLGFHLAPDSSCSTCGSVLFPVVRQSLAPDGRRLINRIQKRWPVSFYTKWPASSAFSGLTVDVSLNGMQMLTTASLHENQIIKLSSNTLDALGRVVNQRKESVGFRSKWRTGIEFITLKFHSVQGSFIRVKI